MKEGNYRLTVRMYTDDLNLDLYRLYDAEGDIVKKIICFILPVMIQYIPDI